MAYNQTPYIAGFLDSLASPTRQDFRLIVTDDASTDGSRQCIERWLANQRDLDVRRVYHDRNAGLLSTLTEAVNLVGTTYLAPVAMDDVWEPHMLAQQIAALEANPDAGMAYSDARLIRGVVHTA